MLHAIACYEVQILLGSFITLARALSGSLMERMQGCQSG